jgi:hypothetical protein
LAAGEAAALDGFGEPTGTVGATVTLVVTAVAIVVGAVVVAATRVVITVEVDASFRVVTRLRVVERELLFFFVVVGFKAAAAKASD